MLNLDVTTLSSGTRIVRPAGALGTCGWHPRAWIAAVMQRGDSPESAFYRANPRWRPVMDLFRIFRRKGHTVTLVADYQTLEEVRNLVHDTRALHGGDIVKGERLAHGLAFNDPKDGERVYLYSEIA